MLRRCVVVRFAIGIFVGLFLLNLSCGKNLVRARYPWAFSKNLFDIFSEDYLTLDKSPGEFVVSIGVLAKNLFCTLILLVDDTRYFGVDIFGAFLAVWFWRTHTPGLWSRSNTGWAICRSCHSRPPLRKQVW